MSGSAPPPDRRKYQLALSFAGEDRLYVESVASLLRRHGVSIFYDAYEEATLWGKNLYDHLTRVYAKDAEFTIMFVSEAYSQKLWTNHERQSAQARAFQERREYILPARFDDTEIPGLLKTTAYIDLRQKTPEQFTALILQKLGMGLAESLSADARTPAPVPAKTEAVCLDDNPLFAAALEELKEHQTISVAIAEAIVGLESAPPGLAEFLLKLVTDSGGNARMALARDAVRCVDKFDIGQEAINYCLQPDRLEDTQRTLLADSLQYVTRPDAIRWAHNILTRKVRSDSAYNSFLQKHFQFLLSHLESEMIAYLLVPARGPEGFNIDSLFLLARKSPRPHPFVRRIHEWIFDGKLDGTRSRARTGDESVRRSMSNTRVLYRYLNDLPELPSSHPLQTLRSDVCLRTRDLLKTAEGVLTGLLHLYVMRSEDFIDIDEVLNRVVELPPSASKDECLLLARLHARETHMELGETRAIAVRLGLFPQIG